MIRKPRRIGPGDRLAVVAPASQCSREEFERGIAELRRLGFEPAYDEAVFARTVYTGGPPQLRASAIERAWKDASIGGLVAVRGGYGSVHVLPLLDPALARQTQKVLIGYSDITSLLTFLTTGHGLVAFYGPTIDRFARGEEGYDRASLLSALGRREAMGELTPAGVDILKKGEASGPLLGGMLTLLVSSLGTPFAFAPPPGYVLLVDEVNERPYRLDRMVTQLKQAGLLRRASAVVIGELVGCDEPSGTLPARSVMANLFSDFPGPVLSGFPCGHAVGPCVTLPLGVRTRVVASGGPRLVIEEAAVE